MRVVITIIAIIAVLFAATLISDTQPRGRRIIKNKIIPERNHEK